MCCSWQAIFFLIFIFLVPLRLILGLCKTNSKFYTSFLSIFPNSLYQLRLDFVIDNSFPESNQQDWQHPTPILFSAKIHVQIIFRIKVCVKSFVNFSKFALSITVRLQNLYILVLCLFIPVLIRYHDFLGTKRIISKLFLKKQHKNLVKIKVWVFSILENTQNLRRFRSF